ncbi:MAG: hypothetical protein ACI831_001768, partial [Candidatus Azotimanducaceae bacterium]
QDAHGRLVALDATLLAPLTPARSILSSMLGINLWRRRPDLY